ncbi:prepilin-type N-terminal cleavage/methylation domain-containing protein [Ruminococcus sp.]|uniref:type IV pilus modification PilV family protein n=1 Tax=Ruminococcus sp. TaxID=41978 RepID=UPI0025851F77|nr:prepilin-type N-terminal cleavage/methylation domain-containing protein [Ruminococcus sp.]MCR5019635.1 prepilin-type N-terminal cleavage/methylation domain-containing protein [Ruminococcus sp.]
MKANKKGMTLVECIVAMGVFAVATTGFVMAASASMRSQAKSASRMTKTNSQSTSLEHFSSYVRVLDPEYSNVRPMSYGTNQWRMTFPFDASTVVNNHVFGYNAKLDDNDPDGVFDLSFFTAAEQLSLEADEYWVTLYNNDSMQHEWTAELNSTDFSFFDNQHNNMGQQKLPSHLWAPNGGYFKFGIKRDTAGASMNGCLKITGDGLPAEGVNINLDEMVLPKTNDNMRYIYFDGGAFNGPAPDEESSGE